MIERIEIANFRKFPRFTLRLRDGNVLVGPNNAGKSSILDAIRLLDACLRHARTRNPQLMDVEGYGVFYGYQIPDSVLPFSLANITFNYSDEDAVIEFHQKDGAKAIIRLHPERQSRFYIDAGAARLWTSSRFRRAFPIELVIVPTLSPLEADERWVEDPTAQRNATTRLANRVLRNIWLRKPEGEFAAFKADVEAAWPSIQLQKPEMRRSNPPCVDMFYGEDRIDREVQWAGFGFQVWLQILTHLGRGGPGSTVVIDEADIYLHPDLQRRLLRMVRERFGQFIFATHSVEMINEAEAHEVVSISAGTRSGTRIRTEEEYVSLYRYLGSTDNADFARIARSRKVIFVEGNDGRLLRRIAARFGLNRVANAQSIPVVRLGGFSQWRRAAHAVWAFRQVLDVDIEAFCLFDRDYRCEEEITEFIKTAHDEELVCRVLAQKELENYLLVPEAIRRAIWRRVRVRKPDAGEPTSSDVAAWLDEAAAGFKMLVIGQRAAQSLQFTKSRGSALDPSSIISRAAEEFARLWDKPSDRLRIVPGKEVLSRLNEILQRDLSISLTNAAIAEQLNGSTIDASLLDILRELDQFCSN